MNDKNKPNKRSLPWAEIIAVVLAIVSIILVLF